MTAGKREIAIGAQTFYNGVMKNFFTAPVSVLLLLVALTGACSSAQSENSNSSVGNGNSSSNANVEAAVQDDVEGLDRIIKLPFTPVEATYSEASLNDKNSAPTVPAPNEKKFVAALKFAPEDAAKVIAAAEKYKAPAPSDVDAETWFPPELIAKSQETGDDFLKGNEYAADDFLQSPYLKGKLTRINETDYFVLELSTF